MPHPDYVVAPDAIAHFPLHEPVYGLTEGLAARPDGQGGARRAGEGAADARMAGRGLPEAAQVGRASTPRWRRRTIPSMTATCRPTTPARQRLAYDELLANQLALLLIRANLRGGKGRAIAGTGALKAKVIAALPFALTDRAACSALAEIEQDMASEKRMLRLLQGDVGSRQDHRGAAGHAGRGGSRHAGGADGAHRTAGAPASGLAGALCQRGRRAAGAA